jgi:hypothetical protein
MDGLGYDTRRKHVICVGHLLLLGRHNRVITLHLTYNFDEVDRKYIQIVGGKTFCKAAP